MISILIADDEALETEALARTLTRRYPRARIAKASNGAQAISAAQEVRPDIVLMDIEMPGVGGLEAARSIREMLPRTRVIMVTAYERFAYAQAAIALGAEGYVLKPAQDEALFALLDAAIQAVYADRRDATRREKLDALSREQFVLSAISGYASAASLARQLEELMISWRHAYVFAARFAQALPPPEMLWEAAGRAFEDARVLPLEYDGRYIAIVLTTRKGLDIREGLCSLADALLPACGRMHTGLGPAADDLGDLQRAYGLAMEALASATDAAPIVCAGADDGDRPQRGLERKLYGYLLERNLEAAIACVDIMLDTLCFSLPPGQVLSQTRRLLGRVAGRLQADTRIPQDLARGLVRALEDPMDRGEMAARVRAQVADWIRLLDAQPPARLHRIRQEIERYLRAHFAEDLSIRRVAQAMHYSEPYFSKLFSRCFHKNFVTYLTDIRMQAARARLAGSMESVRSVSEAVGFSDANYFAKVFKKAYGISPTEYRRASFCPDGQKEEA